MLLRPGDAILFLTFLPLFILGILSSDNAEKIMGKDSRHIVIDEFCAYLLCVLFIPKNTAYLIAGFILFRFFDILKPPPIKNIEEVISGGAGVMLDDILAAVYTNICIQLWRLLI
jgi:phosphatidylglycerophosphatase A